MNHGNPFILGSEVSVTPETQKHCWGGLWGSCECWPVWFSL